MEAKQALVVETINKMNQASNAKQRVQHLEELQELLLRSTPALLDTFLAELVPLQMDKSVQVRRKLLETMSAAVRVRPSPAVLSTAAQCVTALLADEDAQLAREAAQGAHTLLDRGLMMVGGLPQGDPAAAAAWSSVQALQQQLSSKASSLSGSPGGSSSRQLALCLAGIKMAEQAVLQFTSDTTTRLPISHALAAEAAKLIQTLAQLLAAATVKQRAGPVVIAAVKALGYCCLQRPQLLSTTLPPLLTLAQQKVFTAPKPDEQQSGVQASCGAALKDVLVRVYRSNSEASKPWIQQLHQALQLMGADAAAASAHRHLERQAVRSKEALKRKAADQSGREPKVARAGTPAGADSSHGDTPMRTPTPTPMGAPSGAGGGDLPATLMSLFRPGPGANVQEVLDNAQQVLEVLVKGEQHQAIQVVLGTVAPEVLSELVLRWMDNLPPPPTAAQPAAAAPQAAPQAAQPSPAAPAAAAAAGPPAAPGALDQAGLASAGFAQAVQRVLQQSQQQQQQQQPADRQKHQPSQQAAAGAAGPQQQQQQQRPPPPPQAPDPRRKAAARPAAAAAAAAPPKPALPSPLPMPLRPEQVGAMRTAAVQRILSATRHKPIRNFRELLLSRLASRASDSEGLTDLMLQHVLANYHSNRGHLLLVRWLYALAAAAAATGGQQQASGDGPNATADDRATAAGAGTERGRSRSPSSEAAAAAAGAEDNAGSKSGADTVMEDAPGLEGIAAGDDKAAPDAAAEAAATAMETGAAGTAQAADMPGGASPAADAAAGTSREQSPVDRHAGQGPAQQHDQQQHIDQQQQVEQQGSMQQRIGGGSSSGGGAAASLSGTQYEYVFMAAVQGLKEHLPSTDPAIPRLLQDAPVLPLPAATTFLQELIAGGPDWASTGLHAAYSLFESRPAARQALLQLLLDAAVSADSTTREKAVGLVVSKLIGWEQHAPAVLEFATAQLLLLLQPPAAAAATGDQQQQGQHDGEQPANGVQQTEQQQQLEGSAAADAPAAPGPAAAGAEGDGGVAAQQQQQQGMGVEAAAQHSMLYLSLCTLKPELLRLLLETYGKAGPEARSAMTRYAPSLALAIGPAQPVLLELIRSPPHGSLDLLLAMITALADHSAPPQPLVAACAAHYKVTSSVQLLDPVVISLTKDDVIKLLPQLLIQLPDQRLRLLYRRLALPHAGREAMFVPVDLLVLLHRLEFSEADWATHKQHIIMAVDRAMRTPEVFPAAVMQTAISRMESLNPTPRLFMRSVNIMATNAAAPLIKWVLELLQRLITKQIWRSKTQWRGFLVCCEKLLDHGSALVLLQLPSSVLEEALKLMPRVVWKKLHDIASADKPPVVVYSQVKKCVDMYYEKWMRAELEHKQAEVAARQAALVAAAAAAAAGGGGGGGGGGAAGTGAAGVAAGAGGAHHQKPGRASSGAGGAAAGLSGVKPKGRASSGGGPAAPAAAAAEGGVLAGTAPAAKAAGENQQQQPQQQQQQQQQQHDEGSQAAGVAGSGAGTQAAGAAAAGSSGQEPVPGAGNHHEDEEDFTLDFGDSD